MDPTDISQELGKLQDAAQSFTKGDGEVVRMMLRKPALLVPKKCYMLSAFIKVSPHYLEFLNRAAITEVIL